MRSTIILTAAALLAAAAFAQPVPKPLYRDPVFDGPTDPVLAWNRAEKKWFMLYTSRRANAPNTPGVSWVHGTKIGIAESADKGVTWKYRGTAEIGYGKPDYTFWAPDIVDYNGVYHMYLSVVPGIFTNWDAPRDIVHLTSTDLLKWKFEAVLKLASDRVIDAGLIRLPNGTWRMFYKNERDKMPLYYADSPDLYAWTDRGPAITDRPGEGPKPFRWKNRYWLIADMWKGLGVYSSEDCVRWTPQPDNLLSEPGKLPTDRAQGNHADVVVSGDRAFLFYFVHQAGEAVPSRRSSVVQVAELEYKDGRITCDRNQPVNMALEPPQVK